MVGFILLYLLVFRRSWLWARKWAVLLWVLVVLITLGPMLVVFFRDSSGFMARTQTVFILNPDVIKHMEGVYHVNTISALLLEQTRHAVFLFNYYVDSGQQFALRQPFLDPFTAVLFILGLGYVLVRWRWLSYTSVLAWTVLGVVLGCFLTIDAPSWQRLLILLPPTALLAAVALNQLYELANHTLVHIADGAMLIAPTAVTLLIIGVGMLNWTTYVNAKSTWATPRTRIARYLADQPSSTRAYMVSKDLTYKDREFRFLAPGYLFANLTPEQAEGEFAFVGTPTLLILTPEQHALLQQLQQKFPDGLAETHIGNTPTEIAFYVFRLP